MFQQDNARSFYGQRPSQTTGTWQPGEYLPTSEQTNDIHTKLAQMQGAVMEKMEEVKDAILALSSTVDKLEEEVLENSEKLKFF